MTTQAWEDFAAFTATGGNVQQRPAGERGDVLTPAEVGAVFDDLRLQFAAGGRAALWAGIRAACLYNVPMPYWLADALLQVDSELVNTMQSAHDLLGLGALLPMSANRGPLARRKLRLQRQLWLEVQRQRRAAPGMAKTKAEALARIALNFPYRQRQAVTMFDEQDALQQRAAKPYRAGTIKRVQR